MAPVQDLAFPRVLLLRHWPVRWLLTLCAWLVSLAVLAPLCFAGVLLLAGPHSSILPSPLHIPVLILGWSILLIVPLMVAKKTWRRLSDKQSDSAA